MNWQDVLNRDDIVGGDLETQEDGVVYRGPIASIELKNGLVYFTLPWMAVLNNGKWLKWHTRDCFVIADCLPHNIGNGRIKFEMPFLGFGVIFPRGGSKLDPAKVEGLDLS